MQTSVNKEIQLHTNKDEQVILSVSKYHYTTRHGVQGHWIMISNVPKQFSIGGLLTLEQIEELSNHLTDVLEQRKKEATAG
jgi:hypothetical protein